MSELEVLLLRVLRQIITADDAAGCFETAAIECAKVATSHYHKKYAKELRQMDARTIQEGKHGRSR